LRQTPLDLALQIGREQQTAKQPSSEELSCEQRTEMRRSHCVFSLYWAWPIIAFLSSSHETRREKKIHVLEGKNIFLDK
jgi:hypothetical protein